MVYTNKVQDNDNYTDRVSVTVKSHVLDLFRASSNNLNHESNCNKANR